METLLWLLAFPLVWPWIAKQIWKRELSWNEVGVNIFGVVVLVSFVYMMGTFSKSWDQEVWNGKIVNKERLEVSCEHSYPCNCRESCSGSGQNRSCTTICDTCYDHSYDIDWRVNTTVNSFNIDRIDRQGLKMPSRWDAVKPGEPVATTRTFTNYIKAAPDSLFHFDKQLITKFNGMVPAYPLGVYDYHYLDRVISVGVNVPNIKQWNYDLGMTLRDLGPNKQVNVIVIFVKSDDPNYQYAIEHSWLGGKKNDVIVLVGTPEYPKIEWVRIISWTKVELYKVQLRDSIQELGTVDKDKMLGIIHDHTLKSFQRRHMSEFEYLRNEIEPPDWVIVLAVLLAFGGSVGLTVYLTRRGVNF